MDDDGFTLVEMLTALIILALAAAGLSSATHAAMRTQRATSNLQALSHQESEAGALLAKLAQTGPFYGSGQDLAGSAATIGYRCGETQCILAFQDSIFLDVGHPISTSKHGVAEGWAFAYLASRSSGLLSQWPSGDKADRLLGVAVLHRGAPVAFQPLIVSQQANCAFDVQLMACREQGVAP